MCQNNIACLHFNQGEYISAALCYEQAAMLGDTVQCPSTIDNPAEFARLSSLVQMSRIF
jgi:hypothetical protein